MASAASGQRLKVVYSDVVVGVDGKVVSLLVRNHHAIDVLARGADERCDVALGQANVEVNSAVRLRPPVLLGEGDQLARDAALDRLRGERFDLFVSVAQPFAQRTGQVVGQFGRLQQTTLER